MKCRYNERKLQILRLLKQEQEVTSNQLGLLSGLNLSTIRSLLSSYQRQEFIRKIYHKDGLDGYYTYSLTNKGLKKLEYLLVNK